jgi:hypothetical protein
LCLADNPVRYLRSVGPSHSTTEVETVRMKLIALRLYLVLIFLLLAPAAFAQGEGTESENEGPMLMAEVAYLELPGAEYAVVYRGVFGYTFEPGIQLGGGLTGFYLNRPCALAQTTEPAASCPASEAPGDTSSFAGPSPMVGWAIELVDGWFGIHLSVIPTFPLTTGSKGWSLEAGANAYLTFRKVTDDAFGLAIMAGAKFGHFDIEVDQYELRRDEVMPAGSLVYQF